MGAIVDPLALGRDPLAGGNGCSVSHHRDKLAPAMRLHEPVSVTYRTGLRHAETEIGKWRPETGAPIPSVLDRKSGNCGTETRAYQPNPPECRRFLHTRKSR